MELNYRQHRWLYDWINGVKIFGHYPKDGTMSVMCAFRDFRLVRSVHLLRVFFSYQMRPRMWGATAQVIELKLLNSLHAVPTPIFPSSSTAHGKINSQHRNVCMCINGDIQRYCIFECGNIFELYYTRISLAHAFFNSSHFFTLFRFHYRSFVILHCCLSLFFYFFYSLSLSLVPSSHSHTHGE